MDLLSKSQMKLINEFRDRVKQTEKQKRVSQHEEKSISTTNYRQSQGSFKDHSVLEPRRSIDNDLKNFEVTSPEPHRLLQPIVFNATPNEKEVYQTSYQQKGTGQHMAQKVPIQSLVSSHRSIPAQTSALFQSTFGASTESNLYRDTFSKLSRPPTSKHNESTRRVEYNSVPKTELSTDSYYSIQSKSTNHMFRKQESPLGPRLKVPKVQTPVEILANQRQQREGFEYYPNYGSQERFSVERKSFSSVVDRTNDAHHFSSQGGSQRNSYAKDKPERLSEPYKESYSQQLNYYLQKRNSAYLDQPEYDDRDVETIPTSRPISPSVLRSENSKSQGMQSNSRGLLAREKEMLNNRSRDDKENIYNPNLKHASILRLDLAKRIRMKELDTNKLLDLLEEQMVESESFCDKVRCFLDAETFSKGIKLR